MRRAFGAQPSLAARAGPGFEDFRSRRGVYAGAACYNKDVRPASSKPGLEALLEKRLKETGNWPQPPWVLDAMAADLRADLESRIASKIDSAYVQKIYRRKIDTNRLGGGGPQ